MTLRVEENKNAFKVVEDNNKLHAIYNFSEAGDLSRSYAKVQADAFKKGMEYERLGKEPLLQRT